MPPEVVHVCAGCGGGRNQPRARGERGQLQCERGRRWQTPHMDSESDGNSSSEEEAVRGHPERGVRCGGRRGRGRGAAAFAAAGEAGDYFSWDTPDTPHLPNFPFSPERDPGLHLPANFHPT